MASRDWTPAQQTAIDARGGTVLVSAAAGSGKTAVLVERIVNRLTDKECPVAANRLLVVTYTNAAAAELRRRIAAELNDRLKAEPTSVLIRRQILLLPTAHICTTHAFCATLLREHFHLLSLPPDFKVLDEKQATLLIDEAVTATLEELYAAKDASFLRLANLFGSGRDDRDVAAAIRKLYRFIESFPFPDEWLEGQLVAEDNTTLEGSAFDKISREHLSALADRGVMTVKQAFAQISRESELYDLYLPIVEGDLLRWDEMKKAIQSAPRSEMIDVVTKTAFDSLPRTKKDINAYEKDAFKDWRDRAKACHKAMCEWFEQPDEQLLFGQQLAEDAKNALAKAVRHFIRVYRAKKDAMRALDFSDLEHLTLDLLYDRPNVRSAFAKEAANGFDEILVDEYQDTNEVQDAIFRALSKNEQNLFYVGDVKQSIYSFRQACPRLFLTQRENGVPYDGKRFPATVLLERNFRSRKEVTDTVNDFFSLLMRKEAGGIEYDASEQLVCGATYPESGNSAYHSELTLVDLGDRLRGEWGDIAEARAIAADVRRMMKTMTVSDKNGPRPMRYGDFCILLRSKSQHAEAYVKQLTELGIPATSSGRGGFFDTPEIGVLLSLLRFLDNPTLDISLAALLFSPLYRFTVDEMSVIRMTDKKQTLIAAVQKTARGTGELADKCHRFLEQTDRWRTLAPVLTIDRLLERIYDDAAIIDLYGVQKNGQQRTANLQQLYRFAAHFEENGYRGLSAFVRLCDRYEEVGQDFDPATAAGGTADCVLVCSVHHSKGLEFPVVFLAGCPIEFNREDLKGDLLLHKEAGIGLRLHEHDSLIRYDTPAILAAKQYLADESLEEELRVLYVAMTRAKEKLCIVSAVSRPAALFSKRFVPIEDGEKLPVFAIMSAHSYLDWILPVALLHPSGTTLRQLAGVSEAAALPLKSPLDIHLKTFDELSEISAVLGVAEGESPVDEQAVAAWKERIEWEYPYQSLDDIPNKLTVTAIAHRDEEDDFVAADKPTFLQEGGLSPAARGTAMHAFMQFADYAAAAKSVEAERDRLIENGWLTALQGGGLDLPRLRRFFDSPLYKRMRAADTLNRELPFITECAVKTLYPDRDWNALSGEELVTVQGVADCVFVEAEGLVIVDYKTDRVKNADALADRYAAQVRLYAEATAAALGKPVKECLLWSFALGEAVPIPLTKS